MNPSFQPAAPMRPPVQSPRQVFAAAQVIAVVGDQFILAGDIQPQVEMVIEMALSSLKPADREREAAKFRAKQNDLLQKILSQMIETKILYVAFLQGIPEDRREEALPMIKEQTGKSFEESLEKMLTKVREANPSELRSLMQQNSHQVRLARMMIINELVSLGQLDLVLRRYGSSLEQEKRVYAERNLGRSSISSNVDRNREVTHQQMLEYYQEHLKDYEIEAKVRWERLSVHFDKIADKNAAYRMIAGMGNEVLRGAPFTAVAKRSSHGLRASHGGLHDWTPQGSLRSGVIEKSLYELPPNRLSQIIEDDRGFHIVRVLERRDAGHVSFGEAQAKIKKVFETKNFNEQVVTYIAKLREEIKVWTIYDGGPAGLAIPDPASR
jgi:integrase